MKNLYEELHARPPISIEAPKLISTIAFMVEDKSQSSSNHTTEVQDYLSINEINDFIKNIYLFYDHQKNIDIFIPPSNKYDSFDIQQSIYIKKGKKHLVIFQNHMSFFCITFIDESLKDTKSTKWNAIPNDIKDKWGNIISRAVFKTHLLVEKYDLAQIEQGYHLEDIFNHETKTGATDKISDVFIELFGSKVGDGKAIIWTPFRCFESDGFNRILVRADINLKPGRLGRLVRRLIEIDLYTTIACRNFCTSRKQLKELRRVEKDISTTLEKLKVDEEIISKKLKELRKADKNMEAYKNEGQSHSDNYYQDNSSIIQLKSELKFHTEKYRDYYKEISTTAEKIASIIAKSRYDFQAVVAYADLVSQRINELREEYLEGWTRISYFLERTFRPGVRTCQAVLQLQSSISQEIQGASNLLEAGLSLQLQEQEGETLKQHNNILGNVHWIIKNQHDSEKEERKFEKKVEFLAICAIAYYVSSILDHILPCFKFSWLLYASITWGLSFYLLFTKSGNQRIEKLLERYK